MMKNQGKAADRNSLSFAHLAVDDTDDSSRETDHRDEGKCIQIEDTEWWEESRDGANSYEVSDDGWFVLLEFLLKSGHFSDSGLVFRLSILLRYLNLELLN